ncbi:MAG: hypothetical protein QM705_03985 [Ancrocorticia sp.]
MAAHRHEWLTVSKVRSVLRLLLLIVLVSMLLSRQLGLGPLIIIMLWSGSDWLDVYFTRDQGKESRSWQAVDPIVNCIGIIAVTGALSYIGLLPWIIPVLIGLTDVSKGLFAGYPLESGKIHATMAGSAGSAILFLGLVLRVASFAAFPHSCVVAVMFIGIGTLLLVLDGVIYIREERGTINHAGSIVGRGVLG